MKTRHFWMIGFLVAALATFVVAQNPQPFGTAGGDLTGTYPNPTVASIGGKTVSLSGNLATTGAFNPTFAIPATATYTFPGASATLATLGANSFSATQTITSGSLVLPSGSTAIQFGAGLSAISISSGNLQFFPTVSGREIDSYNFAGTIKNLAVADAGLVSYAGAASSGTKFTTSGCSISSTTGGATAGKFTLGANTCTAVVTMNGATGLTATNGWSCWAADQTAPTVLITKSADTTTTASLTIPGGAGATDVVEFGCQGY